MQPKTFHDYMRSYAADHQHKVNHALHLVGIPMIVGSLPLIPIVPPVGLSLFTAGWTLQFIGHAFEGKKPSFASDWRYLAIGPVWVTVEWVEIVTGKRLYEAPPQHGETPPPDASLDHATAMA